MKKEGQQGANITYHPRCSKRLQKHDISSVEEPSQIHHETQNDKQKVYNTTYTQNSASLT